MKRLAFVLLLALPPLAAQAATPATASSGACLARRPVRPADVNAARVAWKYFQRNFHADTGLVNSVDGFPATTMWDLGSAVFALLAARELEFIDAGELDGRVRPLLRTLQTMPLFAGALPNKSYDAATGEMTDYANHPAPDGIGVSVLDVARLVSALELLTCLHPDYLPQVQRVLARWRWCDAVRGGEMHGATRNEGGAVAWVQEGRLGYEQYGAKALSAVGFPLKDITRYDHHAKDEQILGVTIRRDDRGPFESGAINYVVTESYALDAFEFGQDSGNRDLIRGVYQVQKRRWERTGTVTAVSEDHLDEDPWFIYNTIYAAGQPWRTLTDRGEDFPSFKSVSVKAAFALAALFPDDPYSRVLLETIAGAKDPERGWYSGIYEDGGFNRSLSANTNGILMETVLYELSGPLHAGKKSFTWPAVAPADAARSCLPGAKGVPVAAATPSSSAPAAAQGSGSGDGSTFRGPAGAAGAPLSEGGAPDFARGIGSASGNNPFPNPPPSQGKLHITGNTFSAYQQLTGPSFGALATWVPYSYWFVRGGGAVTPLFQGGPQRLIWGFGYDDWHDNTLSVQINNWGPIQSQSDTGLRGAELDVTFKLPRLCAGPVCVSTVPMITVPFAGGPYAGARVNVTFWEKWFVMGGLGWIPPGVFPGPVGTPRWRVMYGIGRWDWRPWTIFVHAYDWGPTADVSNTVVTVGMNWTY